MKLIIDIPEWLYDSISEYPSRGFAVSQLESAILHGTLIPDNATICDIEQIRDEIERLHYHPKLDFIKNDEVVEMALEIIDKYTK